ncbi:FAD-dependent monooxygenase [Rubritalea spongiae]|uniref:FAD-dependent monooxygenase n=1 Tax=Rubritalea spongiae TaxID=430797 RepID=A0ABW5E0K5_9BACT
MNLYDTVIVGGSYAGLSCARSAAAHGLDTLVLERKRDLGAKIRTTGIFVGEAAEVLAVPHRLKRDIHGVRLYAPSLKSLDLESRGYRFQSINTPELMRWMGRQAELNGAEIRTGENVAQLSESLNGVEFPSQLVRARFGVGADGARSNYARLLGLPENREFLVGAEVEMIGVHGVDQDRLHVFLDSEIAPGYIAWVVPGVGVTQIGLAVRKPHQPQLGRFLEKLKKVFDFRNAKVVERRGGLIPCGGAKREWFTDRSMLLGDAAGWVSPLTAGGIHPSLQVGKAAGEAIADFLEGRISHPAALLEWRRPEWRTKQLLRWGMDTISLPNSLLNLAIGNPIFAKLSQIIFFHHRGLKDPEAWKAIASSEQGESLPVDRQSLAEWFLSP